MVLNVLPDDGKPEPTDGPGEAPAGGCSAGEPCGSGLEKIYPTTAVRYGLMRYIGEFSRREHMKFACEAKVVIQTKRGIEIGEQVSLTCHGCSQSVSREQILEFTARSGSSYYELGSGKVLREASADDLAEYEHITSGAKAKRDLCAQMARDHSLDIKIVSCEPLFGGERIIFYFVAEARVDFRALVKDLAREFQTRIEMRQVGARDEARLVADYETCGRECCCRTFLKSLKPVNMKMAKLQKATLDPSKVSGRCGRLKCCLRYEHTSYEELNASLPRMGARVTTKFGPGTVVDRQILTQLLQLQTEGGGRIAVGVEDLVSPDQVGKPPNTERDVAPEAGPVKVEPPPRTSPSEPQEQRRNRPSQRRRRRGGAGGRAKEANGSTTDAQATNLPPSSATGSSGAEGQSAPASQPPDQPRDQTAPSAGDATPGDAPADARPSQDAAANNAGGPKRRRRRRRGRRSGGQGAKGNEGN